MISLDAAISFRHLNSNSDLLGDDTVSEGNGDYVLLVYLNDQSPSDSSCINRSSSY